jgi:hypothetical protein
MPRLCTASALDVALFTFSPPASFILIHGSSFYVVCDAYYAIPRGSPIHEVVNSRGVYRTRTV